MFHWSDASQDGLLVLDGVGMAVNVHEVGRGEEVRGKLRLLIDDKKVVVPHQWSVVSVEELFIRMLETKWIYI